MAARILFITGKGGVGKSAVAEALAREAARRGTPALLVRMPASAKDAAASESGIRECAAPGGRESLFREGVLDPEHDLEAFLTRVLGFGFVARRLRESRTFSAVAAATPGLRDLVALTAISAEAARRRGLIVFDAPSSGHSVPMLTAPSRVLELAPVGPVAREARRASTLIAQAGQFAALLVTTAEELAITEVTTLYEQVRAAGVADTRVIVNAVWPAYVGDAEGRQIGEMRPSSDAVRHWLRHARQAELIAELEKRTGAGARIGYSFASEVLPRADVAKLYDSVAEAAAA